MLERLSRIPLLPLPLHESRDTAAARAREEKGEESFDNGELVGSFCVCL
jgi:hypothetical protein